MKQLLFLSIIIAALSTSVQAATVSILTVSVFADEFLGSDGNFSQSPGGDTLDSAELGVLVTSGIDTFVLSNDASASFDLGFGDNTAITGEGADLVLFTVGNGYSFGLDVYGVDNNLLFHNAIGVPLPTTEYDATLRDEFDNALCVNDAEPCPAVLSGTAIDLFNLADDTEISFIRLWLGSDYNGSVGGETAYPLFSLAGAVHTTAVPLPLPVVLFSSGLALLGWVGRRKTR